MTDTTAPAAPRPPATAPASTAKPAAPALPKAAPKPSAKPAARKAPARKPAKPKREPLVARLAARAKEVRFRVLPLMIFVAVLLLGIRVGELWRLATRDYRLPEFPTSLAENPKPVPPAANGAPQHGAKPPAPAPAAAPAPPAPGGASNAAMAPADGELAQHYAARRAEAERRLKDVEQREALLAATEKRVEQKIQELDKMRADIQKMLRTGDEKQSAQIESLVKIYETMKPKEAARIFEELDMPVLLDVIQRMKEQKTAPILASMDPLKAKQVTSALVERRVMPSLPQQ
ncbi:MotE family protein [Azospirillum sp.]|uniref:MotE family protein n=1 Tax=Azospirillum sp. TaxID=34012 RepID=UPI003D704833